MLIKVNVPLAQGVGVVELSTETTEDVITIRIGDATATGNASISSIRWAPACRPRSFRTSPTRIRSPSAAVS